jgi:two-component system, chemotaxis family, chemotaxis protein CheY
MMQTMTGDNSLDGTLKLPATLDLAAAEDFLATMRMRVVGELAVELDASGVEVITLPCAQIIVSAANTHNHLSIKRPSKAFAKALGDLGLTWPGDQDPVAPGDTDLDAPDSGQDIDQSGGSVGEAGAADPIDGCHVANLADRQPGDVEGSQAIANDETSRQANTSEQQQTDAPQMSKRILTIDDSKTMRDMLLLTLTDAGFEVLQGVDGQDGLDVLGEQRVDVVITDINMPKMDGYEVIRQLRQNPRHKTTPILVLTTESDTEKRNLARNAGATGWMVKPFDPEGLVAVINKVSP